jgi:hypothetical protein
MLPSSRFAAGLKPNARLWDLVGIGFAILPAGARASGADDPRAIHDASAGGHAGLGIESRREPCESRHADVHRSLAR